MADLSNTHPEYERHSLRWKMMWDFYRGGIHVLDPDGTKQRSIYFLEPKTDSGIGGVDSDPDRAVTKYQWAPHRTNSYLLSHERESYRRWVDRGARAFHVPVVKPIVDIFVSGILRSAPKRELREQSQISSLWQNYLDDSDLAGTSMDRMVRNAVTLASVFGRVFAVTDRAEFSADTAPFSAFAQAQSGIRAYTYLVSPLDVTDWMLDPFGNFEWLKIVEPIPDERDPVEEQESPSLVQYRIWHKDRWELWREVGDPGNTKRDAVLWASGPNPLGRVPVSVLYCKKARDVSYTLEGEGIANDLVDIDRSIFNKCSLLDEIDYGQTFSQLAVPDSHGIGLSPVEAGVWSAFTFPSDSQPPVYISPNPAMADGLWKRIRELFDAARMVMGVSRGVAEMSKEARSGVGITLESEEKFNLMSSIASNVEAFERDVYDVFALWEQEPEDSVPVVEYKRSFHLQSLETEIRNALAIQKMQVGQKSMVPLMQVLMTKQLKEMGVEEDVIEDARQEIKKKSEEVVDSNMPFNESNEPSARFNKNEVGRSPIDEVSEIQPK